MSKQYADDGMRLTDCCGAFSSYMEGDMLCCKKCYHGVAYGQGDGSEWETKEQTAAAGARNKKLMASIYGGA